MPDHDRRASGHDSAMRIDLADRLDAALDSDVDLAPAPPAHAGVLALPDADPVATLLSLAAEIRHSLHRPVLTAADRVRIHGRALDIAAARGHTGLRRAWPQLAQRAVHPAVLGGAAAAVVAAMVGVAALQRRGHGGQGVLQAA
jgi:hypothetical protein